MNFKTIVIIILTVLITIIFMQNTDEVLFKILWKEVYVSKLWMMLAVTVFGFIIGVIIARPRRKIKISEVPVASSEVHSPTEVPYIKEEKTGLSDEDRDYID